MHCFYDIESRSRNEISRGQDVYFDAAEYLIGSFARDDGPGQVWDRINGEPMPADLADAFRDPSVIFVAHNASFDRVGTKRLLGIDIPEDRWRCTMAAAGAHGFPQGLGPLGEVLELPPELRKLDGKNLIQRFCIPFNAAGDYFDRTTHPADWQDFLAYGKQDGVTLREIFKRLPKVNYQNENLETWVIDQLINERGFYFDQDLASRSQRLLATGKAKHELKMLENTGGEVQAATQREKLKRYLANRGVVLPNMRASTITEWLEHDDLSPEIRWLLEARLEASKSSGAKYRRGMEMVGQGSRIRNAFRFSGAGRTGRWSGRGFQPQNLPRAKAKFPQIEMEIKAIKSGALDLLYDV